MKKQGCGYFYLQPFFICKNFVRRFSPFFKGGCPKQADRGLRNQGLGFRDDKTRLWIFLSATLFYFQKLCLKALPFFQGEMSDAGGQRGTK